MPFLARTMTLGVYKIQNKTKPLLFLNTIENLLGFIDRLYIELISIMLRRIFNYISTGSIREPLKLSLLPNFYVRVLTSWDGTFFGEKKHVALNCWWWKNDFIHSIYIQLKFIAYRLCVKCCNKYFPPGKGFIFGYLLTASLHGSHCAKCLTDTAFNLHNPYTKEIIINPF